METELEAAEVKEFILRYREGLRVEIISKATGGCPEIIADLVDSLKRALVPKGTLEASPEITFVSWSKARRKETTFLPMREDLVC